MAERREGEMVRRARGTEDVPAGVTAGPGTAPHRGASREPEPAVSAAALPGPSRIVGTATRRRRNRDNPLSSDLIVERALDLTQREGAQALTMRRLGEELGVDPTAVYRHFRDKDELVLACMDRIIEQVYAALEPHLDVRDWRGVLRAVADQSWQACEAHPTIYSLAFYRTTGGRGERRMVELLLSTLAGAGLSPEQAVLHYRAFVDSMLAMCGMKAGSQSLETALQQKDASAWTRIYAILPQEEYPAARAYAPHLAQVTERGIFLAVTEAVISLIEATLRG